MRHLLAFLLLSTPAFAQCDVSAQRAMIDAVDRKGLLVDLIPVTGQSYDSVLVVEIEGVYRAALIRAGCVVATFALGEAPVRV